MSGHFSALCLLFSLIVLGGCQQITADSDSLVRASCAAAAEVPLKRKVTLSPAERAWLAEQPPLRVLAVDSPPLSRISADGKRHEGLAIDLLCRITAETGLRFQFDRLPAGLPPIHYLKQVQESNFDLLIPLSDNPERSLKGHFTRSFYRSYYAAIASETRQLSLHDTSELAHYRVGMVHSTALVPVLAQLMPVGSLHFYTRSSDADGLFAALRAGDIDIALYPRDFFSELRYQRELFDLEIIHTLDEYPRAYGYYFAPTRQAVSEIFDRYIAAADTRESLRLHYLGERQLIERYVEERSRRRLLQLLVLFIAALGLVGLFALHRHRRLLNELSRSHGLIHSQQQQLEQANSELKQLSLTDPLTGLANRRRFDRLLQQEYERWQRTGEPLSLMMLDLDHFKSVNDHYGHAIGDQYLRSIAELLHQHCSRSADLASRYGGEEFICLLPGTNACQAVAAAERIREAVIALQLPNALADPPWLTTSIGIVSLQENRETSLASLQQQVDQMLYRAKRDGRNRVAACTL